jgi:tetratricopeptide (TPR) repeat protein
VVLSHYPAIVIWQRAKMEEQTREHSPTAAGRPYLDVLANLFALVLLTASGTLIADFTRRLIAADADKVGLLSVVVQIATAVVASSTFTRRGMALIDGSVTSARSRRARTSVRLKLATLCFALTLFCWVYLPPYLAWHYAVQGNAFFSGGLYAQAIQSYDRAISLDPAQQGFYVSAGALQEQFYRYDVAEEQYRKAVAANSLDPVSYNDLARMLILDAKPATALKVVEDGLAKPSPAPVATAGLLKNKAWSEWLLGFAPAAITDAQQSQIEQKKASNPNAAAATCLLGKIYDKLGKTAQARAEWQLFAVESKQSPIGQPAIEPDCQLTAEADNAKD